MIEENGLFSLVEVNELNEFLGESLLATSDQIERNLILDVATAIQTAKTIPFAEAYFIFRNEKVVGYTAVVFDETIPEIDKQNWLWQFMIDKKYQGRGYASHALPLIIDYVFKKSKEKVITLSTKPDNEAALKLYKNFGFVITGEQNDDEIILQNHLI